MCFVTHYPSMLVNMELVSHGRPESRITWTASATAAATPPVASVLAGLMLMATIMDATVALRRPSPFV